MRIEHRVVPVATIERYLPHRPPMVWIDDVLSFSEKQGHCRVRLKSDGLYMDTDGLRPTAFIEFIAQAYGFMSVCHHIYIMDPNSKPLTKAFLASIKEAKLPQQNELANIGAGDELVITINGVRQRGSIVMFKGIVSCGERLLCEAEMKVFKEYAT